MPLYISIHTDYTGPTPETDNPYKPYLFDCKSAKEAMDRTCALEPEAPPDSIEEETAIISVDAVVKILRENGYSVSIERGAGGRSH